MTRKMMFIAACFLVVFTAIPCFAQEVLKDGVVECPCLCETSCVDLKDCVNEDCICSCTSCEPGSCGYFTECNADPLCICYRTVEGPGICAGDYPCEYLATCSTSFDCAPGEACVVDSCCTGSVCLPKNCEASMTTEGLSVTGATSGKK